MPAPPHEKPLAQRHEALLRPALWFDEAMRLTNEQAAGTSCVAADPDEVPKAFNAWLRCVAMPGYRIEPNLVSNPNIAHGKAKQNRVSTFQQLVRFRAPALDPRRVGLEKRSPLFQPYDRVMGTWNVPFVTSEPASKTYSSMWVGLDGDGETDLVQAGTGQEATNIDLGFIEFTLTNYYA